ncbi:MAG: hypothetical protein IKH19_03960 [Muribaculaceae bacterium]|nr:hypothetical protein [Muribaculaceae bacterium]
MPKTNRGECGLRLGIDSIVLRVWHKAAATYLATFQVLYFTGQNASTKISKPPEISFRAACG